VYKPSFTNNESKDACTPDKFVIDEFSTQALSTEELVITSLVTVNESILTEEARTLTKLASQPIINYSLASWCTIAHMIH
jgi:hypothetical protein